jgi:hypothetical protein
MFYMARVILHTVDQVPANYVQNQFGIDTTTEDPDFDALTTAFQTFYRDMQSSNIISDRIAASGHEVKYYAMPGLLPNYPTEIDTFNFVSAPGGDTLPEEVALVLSMQGEKVSGFPQNRRRGRVYIGPISTNCNVDGRPTAITLTNLTDAAATLWDDIKQIVGHHWSVWSTVDQDMVHITDGWVDNSFDTQRRRGVQVTSRTTW